MAITSINAIQIYNDATVLAVHSPVVIIVQANYSGTVPDYLEATISVAGSSIGTFNCIRYSDPQPGQRQFMLSVSDIAKGRLGELDDVVNQTELTFTQRENKTVTLSIIFYDPGTPATHLDVAVNLMHSVRQMGENPMMEDLYNNTTETYIGVVGMPCYCYIYGNYDINLLTSVIT